MVLFAFLLLNSLRHRILHDRTYMMSSLHQPPVPPNSVQLSSSLLPTSSFSTGNPILSYTINFQLSTKRHSFFNRRLRSSPSCPFTSSSTLLDSHTVHVAFESNPLYQALCQRSHFSEFPDTQISRLQPHPKVYQQLKDLLTQRIRTEQDLLDMLSDRAADGSPLDPNRDFEQDYKRLDQLYTDLNRVMLTVNAQFLRDTPPTSRQVPTVAIIHITAINSFISQSIVCAHLFF